MDIRVDGQSLPGSEVKRVRRRQKIGESSVKSSVKSSVPLPPSKSCDDAPDFILFLFYHAFILKTEGEIQGPSDIIALAQATSVRRGARRPRHPISTTRASLSCSPIVFCKRRGRKKNIQSEVMKERDTQ